MRQILIRPDEFAVSEVPEVFMSLALGSSLAICLFDARKRIAGMVHTLLPQSRTEILREADRLRFVDTSIEVLCEAMIAKGASLGDIQAKLAGGARIFCFSELDKNNEVGKANILCARQKLQELGITVISEDTGENYGRSVYFHTEDGSLEIETVNRPRYWI